MMLARSRFNNSLLRLRRRGGSSAATGTIAVRRAVLARGPIVGRAVRVCGSVLPGGPILTSGSIVHGSALAHASVRVLASTARGSLAGRSLAGRSLTGRSLAGSASLARSAALAGSAALLHCPAAGCSTGRAGSSTAALLADRHQARHNQNCRKSHYQSLLIHRRFPFTAMMKLPYQRRCGLKIAARVQATATFNRINKFGLEPLAL